MAKAKQDDGSLKRLGGGRWQTRDERFTIEPQSGTWVVVDAEQTDELGLPLVRGPFGSLNAAKEAIAAAREAGPVVSPQASRLAQQPKPPKPAAAPAEPPRPPTRVKPKPAAAPKPPPEPRWFQGLEAAEKRRARELIGRLKRSGAPDPEGIARRDIVGKIPAVAALAVNRAIHALGPDASPTAVARRLALGRDADLEVRWRLVDGEGRPIGPESLDPPS
ncbi:MAG: hypothetical protein ACXWMU_04755 [Candidatus Limnocylindrales bacterium]